MKKIILFLMIALLSSCDGNISIEHGSVDHESDDTTQDALLSDEWICWNPDSDLHGGPCTPECMEQGNQSTFCYLEKIDEEVPN